MTTISAITEEDVRKFAGETNFKQGRKYFEKEPILGTRRAGMILRARCKGSNSQKYCVEVILNDTGIEATACSCGTVGCCKHVVALLLTWLTRPEAFWEPLDIDGILQRSDNAGLISLIKRMVDRHLDLEYLLLMVDQSSTPVEHFLSVDPPVVTLWSSQIRYRL
jgi:uncharacterized Zn finger protein